MDRDHGIDGDGQHEPRTERESGERRGGKSRGRSAGRERVGGCPAGGTRARPRAGRRGRFRPRVRAREGRRAEAEDARHRPWDVAPPSRFRQTQRQRRPARTAATHAAPARRNRALWRPLTRLRRGETMIRQTRRSHDCRRTARSGNRIPKLLVSGCGINQSRQARSSFELSKMWNDLSVGSGVPPWCRRYCIGHVGAALWRRDREPSRQTGRPDSRWKSGAGAASIARGWRRPGAEAQWRDTRVWRSCGGRCTRVGTDAPCRSIDGRRGRIEPDAPCVRSRATWTSDTAGGGLARRWERSRGTRGQRRRPASKPRLSWRLR